MVRPQPETVQRVSILQPGSCANRAGFVDGGPQVSSELGFAIRNVCGFCGVVVRECKVKGDQCKIAENTRQEALFTDFNQRFHGWSVSRVRCTWTEIPFVSDGLV